MSRVDLVIRAVVAAALGLCVGGCGRLGEVIDGQLSACDCHPDPKTVAAIRQEPVLTQAPSGATLAAATETVSCGWEEDSKPPNPGMLDVEVTGAGDVDEVSRFYADLARSSGWQALRSSDWQPLGQGRHVYDADKPNETNCSWLLQVLNTAEGVYHVQITYTPRDLRPTCI